MHDSPMERGREFLKDNVRLAVDFSATDQSMGVRPPPIAQPCPPSLPRTALCQPGQWQGIQPIAVEEAIRERRSRRRYTDEPLSLDALSFLLWATQGIRKVVNAATALRTVPSAGARHAFETFLCVFHVSGLETGVYRYLPVEHQLATTRGGESLSEELIAATLGQSFAGRSAVTFVWVAIPYRMEWRYGLASHKVIALDVGHVCQNLYLACQVVGAGTCGIGAYDQAAMDRLVGVDGHDAFTVYLAPVGKVETSGAAT
jgi:SagB-type dehydrogenase family enzyme